MWAGENGQPARHPVEEVSEFVLAIVARILRLHVRTVKLKLKAVTNNPVMKLRPNGPNGVRGTAVVPHVEGERGVRFRYCKRPSYSVKTGCSNKRFEVELCNIDKCPEKNSTSVKAKTTKSLQGSSSLSSSLMTTEVKAQRTSTILTISRIPAMELSSSKVEAQRLQSLAFELTPGEGILNIQAKDYMGSEKVLLAISTGERPKISLTETSTLANQAVYSLASSYRTLSLTHHSLTRALNTYVESPVTLTISPATTSLDSGFATKDAVVGALLDGEQENVSSFHGKLTSSYYDKRSTVDTSSLQSKPSLKDSINSEPVLMLRSRSFEGGQPLQPATLPSPTLAISPKVQMETPTLNHTFSTIHIEDGNWKEHSVSEGVADTQENGNILSWTSDQWIVLGKETPTFGDIL